MWASFWRPVRSPLKKAFTPFGQRYAVFCTVVEAGTIVRGGHGSNRDNCFHDTAPHGAMDGRTRDAVLGLAIVAAALAGVAFIIFGDVALTTVGILFVILSAVGFLVVVKDFIVGQESDVSDLPK